MPWPLCLRSSLPDRSIVSPASLSKSFDANPSISKSPARPTLGGYAPRSLALQAEAPFAQQHLSEGVATERIRRLFWNVVSDCSRSLQAHAFGRLLGPDLLFYSVKEHLLLKRTYSTLSISSLRRSSPE